MSLTQPTGKRESERGADKITSRELGETYHNSGCIDCLFNNAGYQGLFAPVDDYSTEDFEKALEFWERSQSGYPHECLSLLVCLEVTFSFSESQAKPAPWPTPSDPSGEGHEDQCHWSFLNAEVCVQGDDRPAAWLWHWPRRIEINLYTYVICLHSYNVLSLEVGLARNSYQSKFQDPKMEVPYHVKPYFGRYIPLHSP